MQNIDRGKVFRVRSDQWLSTIDTAKLKWKTSALGVTRYPFPSQGTVGTRTLRGT